ncbi:hypothetical protein APF79_04065 [bacterium BRH_c32]|nr:MAG: hypothetical protein APF79_04065 [bacterium BRH_c32]
MDTNFDNLFYNLWRTIVAYLPNLIAGLLLIIIGWFLGWFIKRVVIQVLVVLRFEKLLARFKWKNELSKADVRYSIYNLIGNIFFVLIFLIFLNSALVALNLIVLSRLIEQGVLFIPKIILALLIFSIGWWISAKASVAIVNALIIENVNRATFFGRIAKFTFIVFFSSIVLIELNVAAMLVYIAFSAFIITLGVITILYVIGNKKFTKELSVDKK